MITVLLWADLDISGNDNPEDSQVVGTRHPMEDSCEWMWQSYKSTGNILIACQLENEHGIVSRLAANSDECQRSLQSPNFFPFVKRYAKMSRIEDALVASLWEKMKSENDTTTSGPIEYRIISMPCAMITRRIILQRGFSQSATGINMDGHLNRATAALRTTQVTPQKADDEFFQTWC